MVCFGVRAVLGGGRAGKKKERVCVEKHLSSHSFVTPLQPALAPFFPPSRPLSPLSSLSLSLSLSLSPRQSVHGARPGQAARAAWRGLSRMLHTKRQARRCAGPRPSTPAPPPRPPPPPPPPGGGAPPLFPPPPPHPLQGRRASPLLTPHQVQVDSLWCLTQPVAQACGWREERRPAGPARPVRNEECGGERASRGWGEGKHASFPLFQALRNVALQVRT